MVKRVRLVRGERGQATVEFAFILPVVLLVIVGLIAFGKAFNYWLDMNHMANEAARWAVVNKVPPTNTTPQPKDVEQYLATLPAALLDQAEGPSMAEAAPVAGSTLDPAGQLVGRP